jgi:hypothetical protein
MRRRVVSARDRARDPRDNVGTNQLEPDGWQLDDELVRHLAAVALGERRRSGRILDQRAPARGRPAPAGRR